MVRVFALGGDTDTDVAMVVVNGDNVPWGDLYWSGSRDLFLGTEDDLVP